MILPKMVSAASAEPLTPSVSVETEAAPGKEGEGEGEGSERSVAVAGRPASRR